MTHDVAFAGLALAAAGVGLLHTLAPDHWVPFAAVARARGWSAKRTVAVTAFCGFGHVTLSAALGLLGLALGLELVERWGQSMEAVAGTLLVVFGLLYAAWGVRRRVGGHVHGHSHDHYDHVHEPARATVLGLFVVFSVDICVALLPILFAAAPLGLAKALVIALVYEVATIGTMLALVLPARAGFARLRLHWLDHWGDAVAGGVIATTGIAVAILGW